MGSILGPILASVLESSIGYRWSFTVIGFIVLIVSAIQFYASYINSKFSFNRDTWQYWNSQNLKMWSNFKPSILKTLYYSYSNNNSSIILVSAKKMKNIDQMTRYEISKKFGNIWLKIYDIMRKNNEMTELKFINIKYLKTI